MSNSTTVESASSTLGKTNSPPRKRKRDGNHDSQDCEQVMADTPMPGHKLARFEFIGSEKEKPLQIVLAQDQSTTAFGNAGSKACVSVAAATIAWFVENSHLLTNLRSRRRGGDITRMLELEAELTTRCLEAGVSAHMHLPAFVKRKEDNTVVQPQAVALAALQSHVTFSSEVLTGLVDFEDVCVPQHLVQALWHQESGGAAMFLFEHGGGIGHAFSILKPQEGEVLVFDSDPQVHDGESRSKGAVLAVLSSEAQLEEYLQNIFQPLSAWKDEEGRHWEVFFVEALEEASTGAGLAPAELHRQLDWWKANSKEWLGYAAEVERRLLGAEKSSKVHQTELRESMAELLNKQAEVQSLSESNRQLREENEATKRALKRVTLQLLKKTIEEKKQNTPQLRQSRQRRREPSGRERASSV